MENHRSNIEINRIGIEEAEMVKRAFADLEREINANIYINRNDIYIQKMYILLIFLILLKIMVVF